MLGYVSYCKYKNELLCELYSYQEDIYIYMSGYIVILQVNRNNLSIIICYCEDYTILQSEGYIELFLMLQSYNEGI